MADSLKDELAAKQAADTTASTTAGSNATAIPAYADQTRVDAINRMYDANVSAQKANLEASYNQNLSNYEANRESIAKRYQQQRNAAATDYERQRRNFNEQAMMNGLNTGVGSQAALAQNAAYQRQQGTINAAEGSDVSTLERNIADLKVQYQNDINSAVADNDYKRAAALLDEYNAAYSRAQQEAQTRASYGDFSGYASIYGQDAANQMRDVWMRQNPGIAYSLGYINANTYYALTGRYPAGYSAGSSSRRSYGYGGGYSGGGSGQGEGEGEGNGEPDPNALQTGSSGSEVRNVTSNMQNHLGAQANRTMAQQLADIAMREGLASMPGSTSGSNIRINTTPVYNANSDANTRGVATNLREFMGYVD